MTTKHSKLWHKLLDLPITNFQKELGNNWKTCPVGERAQFKERGHESIKILKPEYLVLGYDFSICISKKNSKRAKEILEIIENADSVCKKSHSTFLLN